MNVPSRARVWQYRLRAALWAAIGIASFPLGWANSVALVWAASLYANVATDLGSAEAADDRAVLDALTDIRAQLDELRDQHRHCTHRCHAEEGTPDGR